MIKKTLLFMVLLPLVLTSCGLNNSNDKPCAAKVYNSPSIAILGNTFYSAFYSKFKYTDPNATTCTTSTAAYNLMFGKSTDGGATWASTTVKQAVSVSTTATKMYPQSIAVDSNGKIYISYIDTNSILYCAISTDGGNTWTYSQVESTSGITASAHAIITDSLNNVYILYTASGTTTNLKVAKSTNAGTSWSTAIVDTLDGAAYNPSVTIDAYNTIYVAYLYRSTVGGLKFAKSMDLGTSWSTTNVTVGDTHVSGVLNSIAVANGATYISFYDPNGYTTLAGGYEENKNGTIQITKSLDAGSTWSTQLTVDPATYTGKSVFMTAVNTKIYIVYGFSNADETATVSPDSKIKFASSTDSGNTFTIAASNIDTAPTLTVGTSGLYYVNMSLKYFTVNGVSKLYLMYVGQSGERLLFKTSADFGSTWSGITLSL